MLLLLILVCRHNARSSLSGSGLSLSLSWCLWCSLCGCLLDAVSRYVCSRVLRRQEIQILLSNRQLAVRRSNVGILDILRVERAKLPVGLLLLFRILEFGDLSEDRNLLNEVLQ